METWQNTGSCHCSGNDERVDKPIQTCFESVWGYCGEKGFLENILWWTEHV